jgi:transposase
VGRSAVRVVPVKTPEQQAKLMQHRVRDLLVRQRTQTINALRSHLAELGIVAAQGYDGLKTLLAIVADERDVRLPEDARVSLSVLVVQIASCQAEIVAIEKRLHVQHRCCADSKRLETIPGIGVIGATAIVATVPDASIFKTGHDFAAWLGIVPREDSTGGKQKLGPISKQGDRYLRRILIVGALAVLRQARAHPEKHPWLLRSCWRASRRR